MRSYNYSFVPLLRRIDGIAERREGGRGCCDDDRINISNRHPIIIASEEQQHFGAAAGVATSVAAAITTQTKFNIVITNGENIAWTAVAAAGEECRSIWASQASGSSIIVRGSSSSYSVGAAAAAGEQQLYNSNKAVCNQQFSSRPAAAAAAAASPQQQQQQQQQQGVAAGVAAGAAAAGAAGGGAVAAAPAAPCYTSACIISSASSISWHSIISGQADSSPDKQIQCIPDQCLIYLILLIHLTWLTCPSLWTMDAHCWRSRWRVRLLAGYQFVRYYILCRKRPRLRGSRQSLRRVNNASKMYLNSQQAHNISTSELAASLRLTHIFHIWGKIRHCTVF